LRDLLLQNHIDFLGGNYINEKLLVSKQRNKNDIISKTYNILQNFKSYCIQLYIYYIYKPQIILAEYGIVGANILPFCKKYKLPLVVHFHGYDAHKHSVIEEYKYKYKQLFEYSNTVIVVSEKMKKQLINLGSNEKKTILIGYGVDLSKFNFSEKKRNDFFNIFSVGRFVNKKAPYLLILIFNEVQKIIPNAKLTLAGDGYLYEACKRMIIGLDLEKSITLTGSISHIEVKKHLEESDLYIQHSVEAFDGDSEGLPNSILEAAASGTPIISSEHAGISDVLINNHSALLSQENDIKSMVESVIILYNNPDLAKKLALNARKTIEQKHKLTSYISKISDILENAKK
jgi:glycosyltransferase involved in cell wall biosynthesis